MNAKQELIRELEKRGLRDMARKAEDGEYSVMDSLRPFPIAVLAQEALRRPAITTWLSGLGTATSITRGDYGTRAGIIPGPYAFRLGGGTRSAATFRA